jgi:hypothetical protein
MTLEEDPEVPVRFERRADDRILAGLREELAGVRVELTAKGTMYKKVMVGAVAAVIVVGVFIGVGVGVLVQTGRTLDRVESVTNPKARAAQEQAVKDLVAAAVCQVSKELHLHDPMVLLPAGCVP